MPVPYDARARRAIQNEFVKNYRATGNVRAAAGLVGVDPKTIRTWRAQSESFDRRCRRARETLLKQLVDGQVRAATVPDDHGRLDSKAGQFLLKNLDPENYQDRRELTVFNPAQAIDMMKKQLGEVEPGEARELRSLAREKILQRGDKERAIDAEIVEG